MTMEMAFTAPTIIRSGSSLSCSTRTTASSLSKPNSKSQFRPCTIISLPTSLSLFSVFIAPHEAKAVTFSKDQIASSITQVEKTIDQVQEVGSSFLDNAQHVFEVLVNTLKPGVDVAMPILKQAGEQAVKISSPVISEASKQAQDAIQSAGFDTAPVFNAAKTVVDAAQQTTSVATPIASSTVQTIASSDPIVILGAAGTLFALYLVFPPIWSAVSFNLRGYKGGLTPAQTLDLVSTKSYLMVDIRSETDKNKAGIPRLPSSAKNNIISIPLEELPNKLKGIVRNVKKLEAEIAALKISYLKKISKGSNIVILDSYSDSAKTVARSLTNLGFSNCWIVVDGFSGSKGWLQSRLGIDSSNASFAEVVSPSRVIPSAVGRFGTTTSTKFLPGSK